MFLVRAVAGGDVALEHSAFVDYSRCTVVHHVVAYSYVSASEMLEGRAMVDGERR